MSDLPLKSQLKNAYGAPKKFEFETEADYLLAKEDWVNNNPDQYDEIRLAFTQAYLERAQVKNIKLYPRDPSSLVPAPNKNVGVGSPIPGFGNN